jgi:hypothetical protein
VGSGLPSREEEYFDSSGLRVEKVLVGAARSVRGRLHHQYEGNYRRIDHEPINRRIDHEASIRLWLVWDEASNENIPNSNINRHTLFKPQQLYRAPSVCGGRKGRKCENMKCIEI